MLQKLSKLTNTSVINPTKSIVFIFWNIFLSSHDENNGSRYKYTASMYDNDPGFRVLILSLSCLYTMAVIWY